MPQQFSGGQHLLQVDSKNFRFVISKTDSDNGNCDIINKAADRYKDLLFINDCSRIANSQQCNKDALTENETENIIDVDNGYVNATVLKELTIELKGKCESIPYFGMDERYQLNIVSANSAKLTSTSVWGIIRGLETFSQLILFDKIDNVFTIRDYKVSFETIVLY